MHEVHHLANAHTHFTRILNKSSREGVDTVTLTYIVLLPLLQLRLTNDPLKEILFGRIILSSSCGQTLSVMKWPKGVPVTCFVSFLIHTYTDTSSSTASTLYCIPDQQSMIYAKNWHSSCLVNSGLSRGHEVAELPAEVGKQPSHRLRTDGFGSSMTFGQQSISKDWTDIERKRQRTAGMHCSCISSRISAQNISTCLGSRYITLGNV